MPTTKRKLASRAAERGVCRNSWCRAVFAQPDCCAYRFCENCRNMAGSILSFPSEPTSTRVLPKRAN